MPSLPSKTGGGQQISVWFDDEVVEALTAAAKDEGLSRAAVVRRAALRDLRRRRSDRAHDAAS
jgi:hypothetical protein